jgi:hypothetical protein
MAEWFSTKMDITRKVRALLVEYGVSLDTVFIHVYPSRLVLRGRLARRGRHKEDMKAMVVQHLVASLRSIRDVKRVDLDLEDWQQAPSGQIIPVPESRPRSK